MALPAAPVLGLHPAVKPLKFALSIAVFLATMGLLLPALSISTPVRSGLAWLFAGTMVAEMLPILIQALRGTTSHFNVRGAVNSATWSLMVFAIVLATLGMVYVAFVASLRSLTGPQGHPLDPLLTFACRAGLWLLLLAPISGFAMGGRQQHSVGGVDGGVGLPFLSWSTLHGDLRVAHFFALHAVQLLPLLAWVLLRARLPSWARWGILSTATLASAAVCVVTLLQALGGRPFLRASSQPPKAPAPCGKVGTMP